MFKPTPKHLLKHLPWIQDVDVRDIDGELRDLTKWLYDVSQWRCIKENATRLTTNTLQMLKQHKPTATNTCWHKCASVQELTRFTHRHICVKPMHAVVLTDTKGHGFDEHMSHGFHLHVFPLYHTISIFYIYKLSLGSILYLAVTCWNHCSMCHDTCSASIYCVYLVFYSAPRRLGTKIRCCCVLAQEVLILLRRWTIEKDHNGRRMASLSKFCAEAQSSDTYIVFGEAKARGIWCVYI
jgi:hypothetical protein